MAQKKLQVKNIHKTEHCRVTKHCTQKQAIANQGEQWDMNIESVSSKLSFHLTEHLFKTWISQTYKALVTKEATKKTGTKP